MQRTDLGKAGKKKKKTDATNELFLALFPLRRLTSCASYIPKACLVCTCSASFNDRQRFALRPADQVLGRVWGKWIAGSATPDYQERLDGNKKTVAGRSRIGTRLVVGLEEMIGWMG